LAALLLLMVVASTRGDSGARPLPRYDLDVRLDVARHQLSARQQTTWTNSHTQPVKELVFNVFAAWKLEPGSALREAKLLELDRQAASEALDYMGQALQIERVLLGAAEQAPGQVVTLSMHYQKDLPTALVVELPAPVAPGQSVTVTIEFTLRLPRKQGPWGQWAGLTTLCHWHPVLAFFDEMGWHPVPFLRWHPAIFHELGAYTVRLTLPAEYDAAASAPLRGSAPCEQGWKQLEFATTPARTFILAISDRWRGSAEDVGGIRLRCFVSPEHEDSTRRVLDAARMALAENQRCFGDYPWRELVLVESFVGWRGEAGSAVVLLDERVLNLPRGADGLVELIVCQLVARMWWGEWVGVHGYAEAWLGEGWASYFAHRLLDRVHGPRSALLAWNRALSWLPRVERQDFRHANLYGTLGRGEAGPTVQDLLHYEHNVNVDSLVYARGGKVLGLVERCLGEDAFLYFLRHLQGRYGGKILRVASWQRELEAWTHRSWDDFVRRWLYGAGMTDWAVEDVQLEYWGNGHCKARVRLRQRAEYDEPTELGFCFGKDASFRVRVAIDPAIPVVELREPPGRVEALLDHAVLVEVDLPAEPEQIAVDPDQLLPDCNPANNTWHPHVHWRVMPLFTPLQEEDLTCAYDRWNVTLGLWVSDAAYNDPWQAESSLLGARAGIYRTQQFAGGVYYGYRPDFRDLVAGWDLFWDHFPLPHMQVGFNAERRIGLLDTGTAGPNRSILYTRYVFEESDSLSPLPMHFAELFVSRSNNTYPVARESGPGAVRFDQFNTAGARYHLNLLTPYWNPEQGVQFDSTFAQGFPIFGQDEPTSQVSAQISWVQAPPDGLGWLSENRLAFRAHCAFGWPRHAQLFPLGGSYLFRGFDAAQRQGNKIWVGSVEWRMPLFRDLRCDVADNVAGLRSIYLAPFYDIGHARQAGNSVGDIAHAVGIGLRLDVSWFSFLERSTLRFDAARTINSPTPTQFWIGLEQPF
jgi:hypothetical protein